MWEPKTLADFNPTAGVNFHPEMLFHAGELGIYPMRVIAQWSVIDARLAGVLASMLKDNFAVAVSMYTSLDTEGAKRDVLIAASEVALVKDDQALLKEVINALQSHRKRRHKFSHGLWGITTGTDGAKALAIMHKDEAPRFAVHVQKAEEAANASGQIPRYEGKSSWAPNPNTTLVYTAEDLRRCVLEVDRMRLMVEFLADVLSGHPEAPAKRRWLENELDAHRKIRGKSPKKSPLTRRQKRDRKRQRK